MSASGHWYVSQAKSNPDLFRVIFDFNRRPQHWLHPEVVDQLPEAKVVQALSQSSYGHSHLASWLTRVFELEASEAVWDFQETRRRLTLLSPATLSQLACFTGAALSWPRLAAIIGKQQIQSLKATLGERAHAFALRRARMIVPENETILPTQGINLTDHVLNLGWQMVIHAAYDEEKAIRKRFALKLPLAVQEKAHGATAPELRDRAWSRVRQISREVLTQGEMKCFA